MKKFKVNNILGAIIFTALAVCLAAGVYLKNHSEPISAPYVDFLKSVEEGSVSEVVLTDESSLRYKLAGGDAEYVTENPRSPSLKEELLKQGISVSEGGALSNSGGTVMSVLFFCAVLFMVYKVTNHQGPKTAMALNVSDASESAVQYPGFDDIAGNEEAKESVRDIVDFIKNPDKYARYGARMPHGMIFYGPPGTGKTLMAKAIAGEAEAPFYAVSGSDFVQMYVGVGAGRVRDLFRKARENKKAVIFIDEIDALGKKRSANPQGGNDEREQTLNALLTEMSGFSNSEGIIVIAATNRLDTLDEALLRPGRFDRQIEIGLPDLNARRSILNLHIKNKPMSEDVDMDSVAKQTVFFSGAMLENLLNEAAIFAAKRAAENIEPTDIDKAYYTVIAGSEKLDRSGIKERERRITAYHESGHALAAKLLSPENTVAKITIIPSTKGAGGFCVNIPPDKMYYTKSEIENQIMINLAGRAAEELMFGSENVTTGAGNDIEKSTSLARDYITKYAMGSGFAYDEKSSHDAMKKLLDDLYAKTRDFLLGNQNLLIAVSEELLDRETLNEEDLDRILGAEDRP
ncbi:MAG: AAA family ATPase [Clostridiales bacterium]|jgi:cell division protease FtsH|nr:AAA family ATPase [Clostridiales bacterium]